VTPQSYDHTTGNAQLVEDDASSSGFAASDCRNNGTALNTALGFSGGAGSVGMQWSFVNISDYSNSTVFPN
jgi:hypothetical protein